MAINFTDGLRHLYVAGLNSVTNQSNNSLRVWLNKGNFILEPKDVDVFELSIFNPSDFLSTLAFDINRLSIASVETIANMDYETKTPKFLAWKLVNYYYSAFFSAHSILKVLGFGLVQIDDRIVAQLKQRAASYGFGDAVISRGIYCFSISKSAKVVFYKVDKYSDSHKGLWNRFADLLDVLNAKAVLTGKYDSTCVVKKQNLKYR